jgi:hypothetical protein
MTSSYSEDILVEQPAIALFGGLGWETVNCYHETFGPYGNLGRETSSEVVLVARLWSALERLNPGLPAEARNLAIDELTRDRSAMSVAAANREIYRLIKDGVKVSCREANGEERVETVRVIDWSEPENNDFLLASQFWVTGEMYKRRADLVGFVNGLPLLFMELKASHRKLEHAYHHNLSDYKDTIPPHFLVQRLHHPLERQPEPHRQHDGVVGALCRMEENHQRRGGGDRQPGDDDPRDLRQAAFPGHGGELHHLRRELWRIAQAGGQEPPVPRLAGLHSPAFSHFFLECSDGKIVEEIPKKKSAGK